MENETPQFPQVPGYEIKSVLGAGGMATVYLAVQESLTRNVALKVMAQALVLDEDFRRRFLNEGRLIAQLSHPNIVTVYDIGAANDVHYLSMPHFPGGNLDQRINQGLAPVVAIKILKSLASALGYAHQNGIIHRDIKPGNVLFTDAGDPILTDFGIAKTIGRETQFTSVGMTVGSIRYMSPEQALGRTVDQRSDLYSLGVLFWQMLTGSLPYQAQDFFTLAMQHAQDPIPELPEHLRRFQPIIESLLAKRPEDRCASSEVLLDRVEATLRDGIGPTRLIDNEATVILNSPSAALDSGTRQGLREAPTKESAGSPRSPVALMLYAAILGVAGVVGYYGYISLSPATQESAALQDVSDPSRLATAEESSNHPPATPHLAQGLGAVERLLQEAEQHWQAGRITEPQGANAFEIYSRILELDPEHVEARQRLVGIGRLNVANKMLLSAERLLRAGEIDEARRMIETGLKINPDDDRLLGLRRALE